jgi:hypothetical protein
LQKITPTSTYAGAAKAAQAAGEFKSSLALGNSAHGEFYGTVEAMGGTANKAVFAGSRVRPDGWIEASKTIMELKPNNARGIADGLKQLSDYNALAPAGSKTELWLYELDADGTFTFFRYQP